MLKLPVQIRGANILGLPVITTEQYPKALGNTVQELKDVLPPESPVVAKTLFSMLTPDVKELLKQKPSVSQVCSHLQWQLQKLPAACASAAHMRVAAVAAWQVGQLQHSGWQHCATLPSAVLSVKLAGCS